MPDNSSVSVRHATRLLSNLNNLRISEWECDFQIKAGNRIFLVHRAVLAAFSNNYKQTMEIEGIDEIDFSVSENTTAEFVKFVYSGNAAVTIHNCDELLRLASDSDSKELAELCSRFMDEKLATTNCILVRKICKKYDFNEKLIKINEFIEKYFDEIMKTEGFLQLENTELLEFLHCFNFTPEHLWDAVCLWINFSLDSRKPRLHDLLSNFLKKFPVQLIVKDVLQNPLVAENETIKYILCVEVFSDMERFKSSITRGNLFDLDGLCQKFPHHHSDGARQSVLDFMAANLRGIKNDEKLLDLSQEDFMKLFTSCSTKNGYAKAMWEVLIKWTRRNIPDREILFSRLFDLINLKEFQTNFLNDVIRQDSFVKGSESCLSKVMDAFVHRSLQTGPSSVKKRKVSEQTDGKSEKEPKEQTYIAAFMRTTGKLSGYDIKRKHKTNSAKGKVGKILLSTKMSSEEFQAAISVDDNSVYVIKGSELKLHSFKTDEKNSWKKRCSVPEKPPSDAKVLFFQKKIFIVQTQLLWIYDTAADIWTRQSAREITGSLFCVCSNEDRLYILGGEHAPFQSLVYDPSDKAIGPISDMRHPRKNSAAAACKGKIFVLGGSDHAEASKSMEYYSTLNPLPGWVLINARMKFDRWSFAACAHEDKIFAFGGKKPASTLDSIEVYCTNGESKQWEEFADIVNFQAPIYASIITRINQPSAKVLKLDETSQKTTE